MHRWGIHSVQGTTGNSDKCAAQGRMSNISHLPVLIILLPSDLPQRPGSLAWGCLGREQENPFSLVSLNQPSAFVEFSIPLLVCLTF